MMNIKKSLGIVLILCISCVGQVYADSFKDGVKAYESGDYKQAFTHMMKAAKGGDRTAMFNLASMYANGKGTEQSYKNAVVWFEDAARHGSLNARYTLGRLYLEGTSVKKDNIKAFYWLYHAAKFGHAKAQSTLAEMYRYGDVLEKNEKESAFWLKPAADQGLVNAQANLAVYYYQKLNLKLAYKWWALAAEQGNESAIKNISLLDESMNAVDLQDAKKQVELWKTEHKSGEKE